MNNLMISNEILEMTSLQLAELTGKKHQHIMRDIRNEMDLLGDLGASIFGLVNYTDAKGELRPCYRFGKKGAMQLALKYDAVTRFKVIEKIEELEKLSNNKASYQIQDPIERAKKWIEEQEEIKKINETNKLLMHINKSYTSTEIAKECGFSSATALNKFLNSKKIQYKINNTWVLYSDYQTKGLDKIKEDVLDNGKVIYHRKWTQIGREFILNLVNNEA